jgi:hypothetical protein
VSGTKATGVDHGVVATEPLRVRVLAVARHSLLVVHDRLLRLAEAVEQPRLPDVGAPDDCDQCASHSWYPKRWSARGFSDHSDSTRTNVSR